jgi:hypothetical protein
MGKFYNDLGTFASSEIDANYYANLMDQMLTRASYHQPTLMQTDFVKLKGPTHRPMLQVGSISLSN